MTSLLEQGRTHDCGALRNTDAGSSIVLFGWVHRRRDHGGRIFVDLRDRGGITQVVFGPDLGAQAHQLADQLRSEFCIGVVGRVMLRGDNANPNLATGEIELEAQHLTIFSTSDTPAFPLADDDRMDTHEALRLEYRYLDLRRPSLQRNFIMRSHVAQTTRRCLTELGYLELETPYMVKYTPGGARNFLVPSRQNPGSFYALAESPQIFKQLFMVAGFDKYFQITRCFRDEDLRNDRQPEFTQIDLEMSFPTRERVWYEMETLVCRIWWEVLGVELPRPFRRLSWSEAMGRFGTDKPDLGFGLELVDITTLGAESGFRVFESAPLVKGLCVPPMHAAELSRSQLDKLTEFVKRRENGAAKGLAWAKIQPDGSWQAPFAKAMREDSMRAIAERMAAVPGSVLLFVADTFDVVHTALGNLRLHLAETLALRPKLPASDPRAWQFAWVSEFPLFERADHGWASAHHPFTMPLEEHIALLDSDPAKVLAQAYDLVLNGTELGGGSIRIHRSDVQRKIFTILGLSEADAQQKFGFLLEAFRYGPPPHGGIAFGLDRMAMLLCGATSLRDVIAFPKTQKGHDVMTKCPTPVSETQLAELFLRHRPLPGSEA